MAEADGQEKTEDPTGKKLTDTRGEGKVAKSQEINSIAVFGTGLILLFIYKEFVGNKIFGFSRHIFSSLNILNISKDNLQSFIYEVFVFLLVTLIPFFVGVVIISIASGYGQTGFKFTPKVMRPKFSKINPITGFKSKFMSMQPLVELGKSSVKFIIIGLFAYFELKDSILFSGKLIYYTPQQIVEFILDTSYSFLWKVILIYIVFAGVDYAYQRFSFKKGLKMTKQEVKEENKNQEGDPLIKGRIKSKQFEIASRRMMAEVPKADIVITNPTHVAVALKYELGKDGAPKVVAKGLDNIAQKIKEIARENNIYMHEDVQLARALYKNCDLGQEIPENLFRAVAQILAYVYKLRNKKRKSIV